MKGFFLGLTKLILGIALALVLLSLTGVATARYFMAKLSVLPPKPVFDNDVLTEQPVPAEAPAEPQPQPEAANPPAEAANAPENPPGSYRAVVVQPIGLVLRSGPGAEHQQLGGVDHNDEVLVLETSDDGRWMKVRLGDSGQEGWVKAGNTQNLNAPAE
jgi:uncharacterized protein YgiM (DUF1202 family)